MKRKPSVSPVTSPWESRISPFLNRFSLLLSVAFLAISSLRTISTYSELSITTDEPAHLSCGLEYLTDHVYRLETQHPPLTRAAVALLPFLDGIRLDPGPLVYKNLPVRDSKGRTAILTAPDPQRVVTMARLGTLPFFWMTGLLVYGWARRTFDPAIAVLSTALFSLLPPVLAHAGLATTDMGFSACLTAAFFSLLLWAESPNWKSGVGLGVCTALAALTKFSTLGFLPCAAVIALLCYLAFKRPGKSEIVALAKARLPSFVLAILIVAFGIWMVYWFSFGVVPGWGIRLPAPEFFDGINIAAQYNTLGHSAVLFGEKRMKGWWYFFPVMLSVKTPLAFLLLAALGTWVAVKRRSDVHSLMPLAYALGILLPRSEAPSISAFATFCLCTPRSRFSQLWDWRACSNAPPAGFRGSHRCCLFWTTVSGALSHPDYLSYFNELAPEERELITVDSDVDWGQDTKVAARVLISVGATEVATNLPEWYSLPALNGLPRVKPVDRDVPSAGWNLIGTTLGWGDDDLVRTALSGTDYESLKNAPKDRLVWWKVDTPTYRIGGELLFYIPPRLAGKP